jgi:hypothetical protein
MDAVELERLELGGEEVLGALGGGGDERGRQEIL